MAGDETQEALSQILGRFRRALVRDGMLAVIRTLGDEDISLTQLVTLFLLQGSGEPTIKQVAATLGRSLSATGRLLDQLVRRGLVRRYEDERDRRVKRVALTEQGVAFVATVAYHRAGAQLTLMRHLTAAEQAEVMRGMALLAEAARRSEDDGDNGEDPLVW
ncbi:MAG TPA: MarR family transcriptional regulator [Thermomicrobiales bacterium]